MTSIKAPYNFVPLNKAVVTPHWAQAISHDLPFSDQQSGTIKIRIKAHSPIFIKNGLLKKEEKDYFNWIKDKPSGQLKKDSQKKPFLFMQDAKKRYFLPGSSLKGMVRNVLEVMSFAKLENKVNDHRYAIRDLSPMAKAIYMDNFKAKDIYGGWLYKKGEAYFLEDCGAPGRISHRKIDEHYNTNFSQFFLKDKGRFDQRKDEQKAARFKYDRFKGNAHVGRFSQYGESAGRLLYEVATKGEAGTIVFTGQPGPRMLARNNRWTGHHLEFIFFNAKETVAIPREVVQNFAFAYYDSDINRQSIDYKHWKKELEKGNKIPVFFRKGAAGEVLDFGLSFLYKMPYKNSVREAIAHYQPEKAPDLAEAIFGFVNTETDEALKGRVHIGHAFAKAGTAEEEKIPRSEVLSSPKASYYPNYIRQKLRKDGRIDGRNHKTFMDERPEIAGWKRYPIHANGVTSNPKPAGTSDDSKILTKFVPLKAGVEFEGTIRYHNLRKEELGALLSALTFHHTENTFHSIGMAKPLGYGKISIDITELTGDLATHLGHYEAYMNAALGHELPEWHVSEQITELMTMVSEQKNQGNSELAYMKLGVKQRDNHFVNAKKEGGALAVYSKLNGIQKKQGATYTNPAAIAAAKALIAQEKVDFAQQDSIKTVVEQFKAEQKTVFEQAFAQKKAALIATIKARQQEVQAMEAANLAAQEKAAQIARKAERMKATQSAAPDFASIDPNHKKAFDNLKKMITRYVENYYGKRYDQLKKEMPNGGILPAAFHAALTDLVQAIYQAANKKDQKKWNAPMAKNANMKKIGEWVGVDSAETLLQNIT